MASRLTMIGTIGRDAEMKKVGERSVINFPVARTENYKTATGFREKTLWVECSIWTEKVSLLDVLKKGQLCYVDGLPELKPFGNKPGSVLTLRIDKMQVLEAKNAVDLELQ